jgi:hypothetical protein
MDDLARAICAIGGFDPNRVTRIVIDMEAQRWPTVTITMLAEDLTNRLLEGYLLMPISVDEESDEPS